MKKNTDRIQTPSFGNWVRFFLIFLALGLMFAGFVGVRIVWQALEVNLDSSLDFKDLAILPSIFMQYLFCTFPSICFVGWRKKGFRNLKSFDEKGLIFWLIVGLICGLIAGLIVGLIAGLISGLIAGLIEEFSEEKTNEETLESESVAEIETPEQTEPEDDAENDQQ